MEYRITCYTSSNDRMEGAYQWDANRVIKIAGIDFDDNLTYQVHFCNRRSNTAFVLSPTIDTIKVGDINTKVLVTEIPIELLEMPDAIDVYIYSIDNNDEMMTVASGKIVVSPRQRPADYVSQSTGGMLDVANGFVMIDGLLYLARDGVPIGTGIEIPSGSGGSMSGQLTAFLGGASQPPAGYVSEPGFVYTDTAASSAQFTVLRAGHFKLMVIALNSEASTYALNLAVQVNGSAVGTEAVAYNAYSGSGTNRRNYRVVSYSADFSAGDTVQIDLTERSGYTSFVYALLDETYPFGSLMQAVSTADETASGSYSADAIALYGTFDSSAGGMIHISDVAAGTTVTTVNPGTNYKSAYIFWFEKEGS